ncbi:hypothetical protein [Stenotrophomonas virus Jojan60]|jgi:hypothetical protein|nr:hypothetical protein [Stenotrophomonas virus Jojan60]
MMTRFKIWARDYEIGVDWDHAATPTGRQTRETRHKDYDFPADEKWVVESVDSGHESYYATHQDAINSIYEGRH